MTNNHLTLLCLVDGEATSRAFSVDIDRTKSVDHLKKLIKLEKTPRFDDVAADELTLWRVSISDDNQGSAVSTATPTSSSSDHLKFMHQSLPVSALLSLANFRIILVLARRYRVTSGPTSKKIADRFFAPGSPAYAITGPTGISRRESSVIELLCLQWGFYFNAAKKDLGSNDLSQLAESLDTKTMEERGLPIRYCLLDATEIVLENEVQLVEAAFGRIKIFGGTAKIVLDEPFVLKATFNYFRETPSLVSAAERAMLHSGNASVHGCMWEVCHCPSYASRST
ncbi:MAG: hypothetical protein BYD32DRAFT_458061 [Podila humilis]|nr:MAG: hypothetical protein BYD32DRAFT_458061 [Podila humilis]